MTGMSRREPTPDFIERIPGLLVCRDVPDRCSGKLLKPEIRARGEAGDRHVRFDQGNEGKKQFAVEAVLIELIWRNVRSRHHHDAHREKMREQTS